jgi:hypothetical protein
MFENNSKKFENLNKDILKSKQSKYYFLKRTTFYHYKSLKQISELQDIIEF